MLTCIKLVWKLNHKLKQKSGSGIGEYRIIVLKIMKLPSSMVGNSLHEYRKVPHISPGLIYARKTFWWAYPREGLYAEGVYVDSFLRHQTILHQKHTSSQSGKISMKLNKIGPYTP